MTEPASHSGSPLVLIVDRCEEYGEVCADFLNTCGFKTLLAYDTLHAIAVASHTRPEVIVTDIGRCGIDGFFLVRAFKSVGALKDVRIVAVADCVDATTRARATAEGCAALLAKPCDPPHLAATLSALLATASPAVPPQ